MSASTPRPPRPSLGSPATSLPSLPVSKTRKSTGSNAAPSYSRSGSLTPTVPKSGLRAPSSSYLTGSTTPGESSAVSKTKSTPGVNGAGKTIRKTISINSFPQPPRGIRTNSLPPSPLSGPQPSNVAPSRSGSRQGSGATSPAVNNARRRKAGSSPKIQSQSFSGSSSLSLLNGSGDSRSISSGPGALGSDGLLILPSPPQSRSSSAQDSYSTSATTYEDNGDGQRGRESLVDAIDDNRLSKLPEGKGNVIVSVRVRPDAGANAPVKSEGEWMVDGRRSLVAYRGKEGGDYYYGKSRWVVILTQG